MIFTLSESISIHPVVNVIFQSVRVISQAVSVNASVPEAVPAIVVAPSAPIVNLASAHELSKHLKKIPFASPSSVNFNSIRYVSFARSASVLLIVNTVPLSSVEVHVLVYPENAIVLFASGFAISSYAVAHVAANCVNVSAMGSRSASLMRGLPVANPSGLIGTAI